MFFSFSLRNILINILKFKICFIELEDAKEIHIIVKESFKININIEGTTFSISEFIINQKSDIDSVFPYGT
jgi:hypothetical protein